MRDGYESEVLSLFNTLKRLSDEYSSAVITLVSKELGAEINTAMVMYDYQCYSTDIESGELPNLLEKAKNGEKANEIIVFIKGEIAE